MAITKLSRLLPAAQNAQMLQVYLLSNSVFVDENNAIHGRFAGELHKIDGVTDSLVPISVVRFSWTGSSEWTYVQHGHYGFSYDFPTGSVWTPALDRGIIIQVGYTTEGVFTEIARTSITPSFQGSRGAAGPIFYPAGEWDAQTTYSSTTTQRPYVMFGKNYYYLKENRTVTGLPDPAASYAEDGDWVLMDKMKVAIAEAVIADFGKMGAAVFYGDYMYSQYGIDVDGDVSSHYELFAPSTDPYLETNPFRPNVCIDLKNGIIWCGCGKTKLNFDGSGYLAGGNISWDSNGNPIIKGVIKALMMYNPSKKIVVYSGGMQLSPVTDGSTFILAALQKGNAYYILPSAETYDSLEYTFSAPMVTRSSIPVNINSMDGEFIFFPDADGSIERPFNTVSGYGVIKLRACSYGNKWGWMVESVIGDFYEYVVE